MWIDQRKSGGPLAAGASIHTWGAVWPTTVDGVAAGGETIVQWGDVDGNQGRSAAKVQYAQASNMTLGADSSEGRYASPPESTCTQRIPCTEHTSTHVVPSEAASQRDRPGAIKATHISTASSPTRQRMALEMNDFLGLRRMV